jgi:diguanylate cyclase (GGDEF)-like protein
MISSSIILAAYVFEMLDLQSKLSEEALELRYSSENERRAAQERLRYLAYHDHMTGMLNRTRWQELLTSHVEKSWTEGARSLAAVLLLNLDHFKEVNDSYGQPNGDTVLLDVSDRLNRALGGAGVLGRLNGDEFAVLLPECGPLERLEALARRLVDVIRQPYVAGEREIELTCSVGFARFPMDGANAESLLYHADLALGHAKRSGGNCSRLYNERMSEEVERNRVLREALVRAVRRGAFVMHYQPLLDLRTGELHGVEALVRWSDPERGLISPGTFIPLAEETGLMGAIGKWTLEAAISQARAWNDAGLSIRTAINASVQQLQNPKFFDHLFETIVRNKVSPAMLELEVTESAAMKDSERIINTLARCRAMGMTVALDDYGTHYSSLTYLQRLPIDTIKVDGSFVRGLPESERDAVIIRSVISLGHELHKTIVAECIETQDQLNWLRANGCDVGQGFIFAQPMPGHEVVEWSRALPTRTAVAS